MRITLSFFFQLTKPSNRKLNAFEYTALKWQLLNVLNGSSNSAIDPLKLKLSLSRWRSKQYKKGRKEKNSRHFSIPSDDVNSTFSLGIKVLPKWICVIEVFSFVFTVFSLNFVLFS